MGRPTCPEKPGFNSQPHCHMCLEYTSGSLSILFTLFSVPHSKKPETRTPSLVFWCSVPSDSTLQSIVSSVLNYVPATGNYENIYVPSGIHEPLSAEFHCLTFLSFPYLYCASCTSVAVMKYPDKGTQERKCVF